MLALSLPMYCGSSMTIRNYPLAQSLYLKYCRDHNIETLRDIYDQEDNHNAKAAFYLKESYEPKFMATDPQVLNSILSAPRFFCYSFGSGIG
uniref:Vps16 C-terminal domain-containing protein n=1 Tax=Timema poppense TaxID=170557 RepID=A0A7R9H3H8_TIMPO|nr:unnamed protein product [Timema poppensis]